MRRSPLGPSARRRLAWLAGSAVAIAVVGGGAIRLFDSGSGSPATEPTQAAGEQDAGIAFGAKPGQVLAELGPPTEKRSACWVYAARAHRVGDAYLGRFVDGLKYCFGPGPLGDKVVTNVYAHIVPHTLPSKKWFPGGWDTAIAVEPGRA